MDYFFTVLSVIVFVENRVQDRIDYNELEKATGFSLAHIRDVFAKTTGTTLSKYILNRKIANAAYEILYNRHSIITIATKYGFSNHDTFTRAFKRVTGLTPSEFRRKRPPVRRIMLCAGLFGIGLPNQEKREDDKS
ncbi:MAG: helix-turn-helix transcriptional regulator [Clostridiaceae bacterium]|jgi:AraC-like DNA-binding protein|nr:helix-turn-helix transcriptional regulator [Clostridiaceae bacterium]